MRRLRMSDSATPMAKPTDRIQQQIARLILTEPEVGRRAREAVGAFFRLYSCLKPKVRGNMEWADVIAAWSYALGEVGREARATMREPWA
jgi:hypothetical protein